MSKLSVLITFALGATSSSIQCSKFPSLPNDFEPSGIVWHEGEGLLFSVGDEGQLAGFTRDGVQKVYKSLPFGDCESITVVPSRPRYLYIGVEYPSQIVEFSLDTMDATGNRWSLPDFDADSKHGMEGLTFVPSAEEPSFGLFFAGSQKTGTVSSYRVDFNQTGRSVAAKTGQVYSFGLEEVSGLAYNVGDDDVYAVADGHNNELVVFHKSGAEKSRLGLPMKHPEGVTAFVSQGKGTIYITHDDGKHKSAIYKCEYDHGDIMV